MRYGKLCEALPRDNILEQQWSGSGSLECQSLNRHNFLETCLNGTSEVFIGIYEKIIVLLRQRNDGL